MSRGEIQTFSACREECLWCREAFGDAANSLPRYTYGDPTKNPRANKEGVWVYSRGMFMFKNPSHAVEFKLRFG